MHAILKLRYRMTLAVVFAAATAVLMSVPAFGSVVDLRGIVSGEAALVHHYTFEGATDAERLLDKAAGGDDLSVVSYGTGSTTIGAANGISFTGPAWDGTTTTLTPYNDGGGISSGGAGLSTVSNIGLPATMTVETIFRPMATPSGEGYGLSARPTGGQRGYYLMEDANNRLPTVIGDDYYGADNNRTVLAYFRPGEWYYMVNTYDVSGGNTTINSHIANLSQGDTGLTKVLDGVVASGSYGTSAPLGVGLADWVGQSLQRAYVGQIDEVAIYNAVLDQAAAQTHYTALRSTAVAQPNLVGHWKFDGDLTDSVGTRDGTAIGDASAGTDNGKIGGAVSFDGNNDAVRIAQDVIADKPFTIAFWEYSPAASTNEGYFVGAGPGGGAGDIFLRRYRGAQNHYAGGITQTGSYTFGEPGPFDRGQWHFNVVTHDGSNQAAWYVDGALAGFQATTFTGLRDYLYLGNRGDLGRDFDGRIDDLQIYDAPISSTQAAAMSLRPGSKVNQWILTTLPVANGSFEMPEVPASAGGVLTGVAIPWWNESASAGPGQDGPNSHILAPAEHAGGISPAATQGEQVANLNTRNTGVTDTWIFQSLGVVEPEDVDRIWMLEVDVAARGDQQGGAAATAAFATGVTVGDLGVNVGDMLPTATDSLVLPEEGFHGLMETIAIDGGLVGQELWIRLSLNDPSPSGGSDQYFFDNVRLTQVEWVPEPAALVLLGLGAVVLLPLARRRRGFQI